ncbi:MAG: copper resistance protein CopC [Solirubrobacterales bacterium]
MKIARTAIPGAACAALALAVAVPALAHAPVTSRYPKPGSSASKVKAVSVGFGDRLITGRIEVRRAGVLVRPRSSGPTAKKTAVRASFSRALPPGSYTVTWRAMAGDGHRQAGSWSFRVR